MVGEGQTADSLWDLGAHCFLFLGLCDPMSKARMDPALPGTPLRVQCLQMYKPVCLWSQRLWKVLFPPSVKRLWEHTEKGNEIEPWEDL